VRKIKRKFKNKRALGAVAGIVIDEGADRQRLFVITQSGETVFWKLEIYILLGLKEP